MVRNMLPSVFLVALAGCLEAPVNTNPVGVPDALNAITGSVVYGASDEEPAASTFITVYSAANPGPPAGTGGPLTFSTVPADSFSDDGAGLRAADYTVSGLPDGTYLVNALSDQDNDFNPFVSVLAGATCGDWVGTHLASLTSTDPAPVPVAGGQLRDGVTVVVGAEMTSERPAFAFGTDDGAGPIISLADTVNPLAPVQFSLSATDISAMFSPEVPVDLGPACPVEAATVPCGAGSFCGCDLTSFATDPCQTALYVWVVDADSNGFPDPYPNKVLAAAGLLDVWPRVFLESLDDSLGTFEYEGRTYDERWVAQAHPLAAEFGAVSAKLAPPEILPPVGTPLPVGELSVTFVPAFLHYHADGQAGVDANGPFDIVNLAAGADGSQIPTGAWSTTVMSFTGQTWAVPNEVGVLGLPGLPDVPDFDPTPQGSAVVFTP